MSQKNEISKRIPSLDGWRAFSILMVIGAHTKSTYDFPEKLKSLFQWLFDGDLGVRTFFVISGFLITRLLLEENTRNGAINLKNFYIRRILRIWPVYFAYLLTLFVLQIFTPYSQSEIMWVGNVLFLTNFMGANWTNGHLWSLAVEEQFYFLWPLLLLFTRNSKTLILMLTATFIISPLSRVISYLEPSNAPWSIIFADYSFFNYCDSLALGCLFSILFYTKPFETTFWCQHLWVPAFLFIFTPYLLNRFLLFGKLTVPFGPLMQGVGISILIIVSIQNKDSILFRVLNTPVLVKLGVLSYSIYIWQMIFCSDPRTFGLDGSILFSWKTWYIPVLFLAFCSYHLLEKPFLELRKKFHRHESG